MHIPERVNDKAHFVSHFVFPVFNNSFWKDLPLLQAMKINLLWLLCLNHDSLPAFKHIVIKKSCSSSNDRLKRMSAVVSVNPAIHNRIEWQGTAATRNNEHNICNKSSTNSLYVQSTDDVGHILSAVNDFLNRGGRMHLLSMSAMENCSENVSSTLQTMGFNIHELTGNFYCGNASRLVSYCTARLQQRISLDERYNMHNTLGRLAHGELNDPGKAITHYTLALTISPNSSATFRNMGAAYHAAGNFQLAFASYQQAIQLEPSGDISGTDNIL